MVPDHADPPSGLTGGRREAAELIVASLTLRDFRSYAALDLELRPGIVLAFGPNGAGKTNLLEALHVGAQGFSPRTRNDANLVRAGAAAARVAVRGETDRGETLVEVLLRPGAKEARMNGAPLASLEQLRAEAAALVFTPDRLAVVKSGPSVRRLYVDRALARLFPARSGQPAEYAGLLAQRNAALRRVAAGLSSPDAVVPWTERLAAAAATLSGSRREVLGLLEPGFAEAAGELGLVTAALEYEPSSGSVEALAGRLALDLERGVTGAGPHLDEIRIIAGGRELRTHGSQGEQRVAVLALLLAEADLLRLRRRVAPLLLLDDVLSELDGERRASLVGRLDSAGQVLVTAAARGALPGEAAQLLEVAPGRVSEV